MADKQTFDPLTLDREGLEAQERSTRDQWSLLAHLLHMPTSIESLDGIAQRIVARSIAERIAATRGGLANIPEIEELLLGSFREHLRSVEQPNPATEPVRAAATRPAVRRAEAWLRTIYEHFGEQELRQMILELPASIRPIAATDPPGRWQSSVGINIGGHTDTITIDLSHPIWRNGDRRVIAQALLGKLPGQCGILTTNPHPIPLVEADIESIFNSECPVIDPMLPVGQITLENILGLVNERIVVDVASLIRTNPGCANNDATALHAAANFEQCITRFDTRTGEQLIFGVLTAAQRLAIANALFNQLSRDVTRPFASREVTLDTAIQQRQPIDRLVSGNATNRELILALSMIQRDPAAAGSLEQERGKTADFIARRSIAASLKEFEAAQPISIPPPLSNDITYRQCMDMHTALTAPIAGLVTEESRWNAADAAYQAAKQTDEREERLWEADRAQHDKEDARFNAAEANYASSLTNHATMVARAPMGTPPIALPTRHILVPPGALRARPVPTAHTPVFTPIVLAAPVPSTVRSIEELRTKLAELRTLQRDLDVAQSKFLDRVTSLEEFRTALNAIPIADVDGTFPNFSRLVTAGGVIPTLLRATTNFAPLAVEIRNKFPNGLDTPEIYDNKIAEEKGKNSNNSAVGSEACRAVVERGLSHQGLRDAELKDTVDYMFTTIQRDGEATRDLEMYAERAIPDGLDDHVAEHDWNHGVSHSLWSQFWLGNTRVSRFFGLHHNTFHDYIHELAEPNNLGFDLHSHQTPDFRQFRLSRLIEMYFNALHLTELPDSDPHHVPKTESVVRNLRALHTTICDRSQRSFQRASGMNDAELNEMRAAGMNVKAEDLPRMTYQDRLQLVHSFLNNREAYMSDGTNKTNFDRMVERAYRPIRREIDAVEMTNPFGTPRLTRPHTYPKAIVGGTLGLVAWGAKKIVKKTGDALVGIKNNAGAMTSGAVLAGMATSWLPPLLPFTMTAGALGGLGVKKIFFNKGGGSTTVESSEHTGGHH